MTPEPTDPAKVVSCPCQNEAGQTGFTESVSIFPTSDEAEKAGIFRFKSPWRGFQTPYLTVEMVNADQLSFDLRRAYFSQIEAAARRLVHRFLGEPSPLTAGGAAALLAARGAVAERICPPWPKPSWFQIRIGRAVVDSEPCPSLAL